MEITMLSMQSIKAYGSPSRPFVSHHHHLPHHQLIHQPSFDNHFSRHPKKTASTNLKMKFFTTLLSMVTLTSAAAVNYDFYAPVNALAKREAAAALSFDPAHDPLSARGDEDVNIITASLDDGAEKVEIIVDGVSQGYLIVSPGGDVQGFDGNGTLVDLDAVLAARDVEHVDKRALGWLQVLARLAPIITKFGQRVVNWLRCVGAWSLILDCAPKLINCATYGKAPWECIAGINCIGKAARNC
ncbi:hypothetical protein QC764_503515 [Podospora pseudoanserina]|uniref:Uncharacterized protein n=1 Tax=Podospora pseudoanserina TaxID=2609844 RepID=A0ABR0I5A9_9PEZI|nr:hypothetical protein QC764_503515 [Podospora pseudoanserina]